MTYSGDTLHGGDELRPRATLLFQHRLSIGRQFVITAPALSRLLDPLTSDPSALLQSVQERIEGCDVELQRAVRALLDELADLVSVAGTGFEQGEDQELGAALFQFPVEDCIWFSHI